MPMNSISNTSSSKEPSRYSTMNNITDIDMIDKNLIKSFQVNNHHMYHHNIFKMSVAVWKETAKLSGPSDVKLIGKKYVNYYSMQDIAAYLDNNYSKIVSNYKKRIRVVRLGFMRVPEYKHYTYRNKSGQYRTTSSFQGYNEMIGFIKGDKLVDYDTGVKHNLSGKKVDFDTAFSNFHDFNNYLVKQEYPKVSYKEFKRFLLRNKVYCRKLPNPNNKHEMQESRETDVLVAKLIKQRQLEYNKQNPTALQLRKLANQHQYNNFLSELLSHYNGINQQDLVGEVRSHVYFYDVFHMPKHLVDWLTEQNK